jgi:hypothetical protein
MARVEVPITVLDLAGNAVSGAAVRIKHRSDGVDADVYTGESGFVDAGNPLTTDASGRVNGWIEAGRYYAVVSGTGLTTYMENFDAVSFLGDTAGLVGPGELPFEVPDGTRIYYSPEEGVIWHLRYREDSASPFKWEFIGGNPIREYAAGPNAFSNNASPNTDKAVPSGPSTIMYESGDYEVEWGGTGRTTAAAAVDWRVKAKVASTLVAAGVGGCAVSAYASGAYQNFYYKGRINGVNGADTCSLYTASSTASLAIELVDLVIAITPVRIGYDV